MGAAGGPPGEPLTVTVTASLAGERVDRAVALLAGLSRAAASDLVAAGGVRIDGEVVHQRRRLLHEGQALAVDRPEPEPGLPVADPSVDVPVVFADEHLIVVDKPAGLVVHRGAGRPGGTMVEGLLARFPELAGLPGAGTGDPDRPGIVHRLDKDTSGLLVVARTAEAHRLLAAQFRDHRARRGYLALVRGVPESPAGIVDAPIGRSVRTPTRMAVTTGGRPARTAYRLEQAYDGPVPAALLRLELETGRTHQVRVHLAAIGHPVVGDARYGRPAQVREDAELLGAARQMLHAWQLAVIHPDGRTLTWESPPPADFRQVLDRLRPR